MREIRFGRGGWVYREDTQAHFMASYKANTGFTHFCGLRSAEWSDQKFLPSGGYLSDKWRVESQVSEPVTVPGPLPAPLDQATIYDVAGRRWLTVRRRDLVKDGQGNPLGFRHRCTGLTGRGQGSFDAVRRLEEGPISPARPGAGRTAVAGPLISDLNGDGVPDISMTVQASPYQAPFPVSAVEEYEYEVPPQRGLLGDDPPDQLLEVRAGNSRVRYQTLNQQLPIMAPSVPKAPSKTEQFLYVYSWDTEPYTVLPDPATAEATAEDETAGPQMRFWRRRNRLSPVPENWPKQSNLTPLLDDRVIEVGNLWQYLLSVERLYWGPVETPLVYPHSKLEIEFSSFFRDTVKQAGLRRTYDAYQACVQSGNGACGKAPETTAFPCTSNHEHGEAFDISRSRYTDDRNTQISAMKELDIFARQANLYWLFDDKGDSNPANDTVDVGHFDIDHVNGMGDLEKRRGAINQAQLDFRFGRHLAGDPLLPVPPVTAWAPIVHCYEIPSDRDQKRFTLKPQ